jgi:hypothetical protein
MTKAWTTLLMIFTLAGLLFTAGCTKSAPAPSAVYVYASDANRAEFISTFATEPTCHGLTVVTALSGKEPRLHYQGNVINAPFPPSYGGYIVMPNSDTPSSDIDFSGDTAQSAVRQACDILQHKGGTVR